MTDLFNDLNYRRTLIVDRYENPHFLITDQKAKKLDSSYVLVNAKSDQCIDNFKLYVKECEGIIKDIKYSGEGCVIAVSSTDFLSEALINKNLNQAQEILSEFLNLVTNQKKANLKKIPDFLNLYNQVYKQSNRIKCASLVTLNLMNHWKE